MNRGLLPRRLVHATVKAMEKVAVFLPYIEITLSVLLIAGILLQQTGASVGGGFGSGDNFSSGFHTRRGFERTLFIGTIIVGILFALTAFTALII